MSVPEGWFDYSRFGSPIGSTRIVAVKTPLKQKFNTGRPAGLSGNYAKRLRGVPIEEEFTPAQMLQQFEERGWNVRLVIDLTFTHRYYNPEEFTCCGVQHTKLKCPGQIIPPDDIYHKLSARISEFLSDPSNDDSLVAVHCTHGLNRTGYLLCRYLMEKCGYDADSAIEAFNKSRGSNIERENYLQHLRNGCPKGETRRSPARDRVVERKGLVGDSICDSSEGRGSRVVRPENVRRREQERDKTVDLRSKLNNRRGADNHSAAAYDSGKQREVKRPCEHERRRRGGGDGGSGGASDDRPRKRARYDDDYSASETRHGHSDYWYHHSQYMSTPHTRDPHYYTHEAAPGYHTHNDYAGVNMWRGESASHFGHQRQYHHGRWPEDGARRGNQERVRERKTQRKRRRDTQSHY